MGIGKTGQIMRAFRRPAGLLNDAAAEIPVVAEFILSAAMDRPDRGRCWNDNQGWTEH